MEFEYVIIEPTPINHKAFSYWDGDVFVDVKWLTKKEIKEKYGIVLEKGGGCYENDKR